MYTRSVSPEQAPDKATYIDLEFEGGNPVAIDGQQLSPASLLTQLNKVTLAALTCQSLHTAQQDDTCCFDLLTLGGGGVEVGQSRQRWVEADLRAATLKLPV